VHAELIMRRNGRYSHNKEMNKQINEIKMKKVTEITARSNRKAKQ
jgi:hypothetical protein